MLYPQCFS